MKIFKKALISTGILLCYSNNVLATTAATYVPKESSGVGKIFLFIMAVALVSLVLFVGYKMDKNEAQEKRKEKIIKKRNDDIDDMYSEIYTSYNGEVEENEVVKVPEKNIETTQKIDVVEDKKEDKIVREFSKEDLEYFENNVKTVKNSNAEEIETEKTKEDEEAKEIVKEKTPSFRFLTEEYAKEQEEHLYNIEAEEEDEAEVEDHEDIEDIEIEDENVVDVEDSEYEEDNSNNHVSDETQVVSLNEMTEDNSNTTMVFDTSILKEFNEDGFEKMLGVKGYDYEDDDVDLKELEQTIADSNIKKFTRKKDEIQEIVETKKYTRKKKENKREAKKDKASKETKKEVKDDKKKTNPKRYTGKKAEPKNDKASKVEKSKKDTKTTKKYVAKKDVKKETKNVKEETEEKPKRGRKPASKK